LSSVQHEKPTRIGVAVVHGIGDQRRFEHIDGQVREIIGAMRARPGSDVTVVVRSAASGAFRAEQDSWAARASVHVIVRDGPTGKLVHVNFHEVWWADVNEPYSLFKQLRFWCWSLAVWLYPDKPGSLLPTATEVRVPVVRASQVWVRLRLFGVAFVAVIGAASIGMLTFLAERVLDLRAPDLVRVFVNYVAGVKLYNQKRRWGAGFPAKQQDFLDTIDEPPRVSIRRRMIRTIMDMAQGSYDRWYVLAHSLGSVVALNGLMETAYAWPGYLDEEEWRYANYPGRPDLVGPARPNWPSPPPGPTMPRRPVWAGPRDVAYRSQIFRNFHGLLTLGSPLEKFATIWPARVAISREPAFRTGTHWLNIYDPLDPISGRLSAFSGGPSSCCPSVENIGYKAGPLLLLTHLRYLSRPKNGGSLVDGVAEWLISGSRARISSAAGARWFRPGNPSHTTRAAAAWLSWAAVVVVLTGLGALIFPLVWSLVTDVAQKAWLKVVGG